MPQPKEQLHAFEIPNWQGKSLSEISQEKAKQKNKPMDRILKLEDLKNRRIVFKRKQSAESEPK